jgi:hypothetical protein
MTILNTDIKLLKSERMTDTSDGGGRRTSTVIPDGVAGNIFPKISRLDSVYGRVNLRKIYGAVVTANLDTYAGSHAVITDAPDNPQIHATLFSTASDFDDRTAARDRIESYVIAGPESRMIIYGRQLVGQQAVQVYQRVEEPLPEVGEVYSLSKEISGVTTNQQYIRVEDLEQEVRTFTDLNGSEFQRRIISLILATPLRYEYAGPETPTVASAVSRTVYIRRTTVADASHYYGIQKLSEAALEDDLVLKVASVYTPIVPTTQRETAVANAEIAGATAMKQSGAAIANRLIGAVTVPNGVTVPFHIPTGCVPGSVELHMNATGVNTGGQPSDWGFVDNGLGVMTNSSGNITGDTNDITIDYETGIINFSTTRSYTAWNMSVAWTPSARVAHPGHTMKIPVTLGSRSSIYIKTLYPLPALGTMFVDFRALGKWYRLRDDGTGALLGDDPAYGTGTIDPVTGVAVITLGALPDVGSNIQLGWGSSVHYTIRANGTSDARATAKQSIQLNDLPINPGSLSVSYLGGVTTYTATDSAGVISGGGITGTVNYATGEVDLFYSTRLPNMETVVTLSWNRQTPTGAPTTSSGTETISGALAFDTEANLATKGVKVTFPIIFIDPANGVASEIKYVTAADDGSGNLKTTAFTMHAINRDYIHGGGSTVGTVNYTTGHITMSGSFSAYYNFWKTTFGPGMVGGTPLPYVQSRGVWEIRSDSFSPVTGDYAWTVRTTEAFTTTAFTHNADPLTDAPIQLELTNTITSSLEPGSVMFTAFGLPHIDRDGIVYRAPGVNGVGTNVGDIDYLEGTVTLAQWVNNTAVGLSVLAGLTKFGNWTADYAAFRTAGAPLRPSSMFVQVTALNGDVLTATSNDSGVLTGAFARGEVNQATGSAYIEWGELVVAAGNEAEEWYDAAVLEGSNIWKPRLVFPSTIRYNCVVLSNLPLNADQLGLDPIRLPSDGRVPIYRPADVVVIHNTKSYSVVNPAVAGATYSVSRTNLSDLWLIDALGVRVSLTKYAVDLAAGTVTMAAVLDLSAYTQPLTARHRIEELNLLSDVQINGELGLTGALSRDFDATDTYVSSALLFGDLFARVTGVFDQVSWTSVWSDTRIGSDATATYDTVNHPFEVLNNGCVTERWRINFTTTTAFQVIGENLGVIATGTTAGDVSPSNTLTGLPYFTIRAAGWGAGWAAGNNLRFNTIGATAPIWIARTVLPGATLDGDSIDLQLRGDVDA